MQPNIDTQIEPIFYMGTRLWNVLLAQTPEPLIFVIPENYQFVLREIRSAANYTEFHQVNPFPDLPHLTVSIESSTAAMKRFREAVNMETVANLVDKNGSYTNGASKKNLYGGQAIMSAPLRMPFECHGTITVQLGAQHKPFFNGQKISAQIVLCGNLIPKEFSR